MFFFLAGFFRTTNIGGAAPEFRFHSVVFCCQRKKLAQNLDFNYSVGLETDNVNLWYG